MSLFLLRHAQTDGNVEPARCQGWQDAALDETGRAQARARGGALRGRGIEVIVTSHLRRARETAELVRRELPGGVPIVVDPRLAETHRGRWEGRRYVDIIREEPAAWRAYREHPETFRFPGGESLAGQQRRTLSALRDVALDGRTTLIVTHGGTIRLVHCFLDRRGIAAFHEVTTANGGMDEIEPDGLFESPGRP